MTSVAPARERGLKLGGIYYENVLHFVAPARERGLKLVNSQASAAIYRRSREGAWIEILVVTLL